MGYENASCVNYNGLALPFTGIQPNTTLDIILNTFDTKLALCCSTATSLPNLVWSSITLNSPHTAYMFGVPQYTKDNVSLVKLRNLMLVDHTQNLLFVLPSGFRPFADYYFSDTIGTIQILLKIAAATGACTIVTPTTIPSNFVLDLSKIGFDTNS
jgi:hypothetical protein